MEFALKRGTDQCVQCVRIFTGSCSRLSPACKRDPLSSTVKPRLLSLLDTIIKSLCLL